MVLFWLDRKIFVWTTSGSNVSLQECFKNSSLVLGSSRGSKTSTDLTVKEILLHFSLRYSLSLSLISDITVCRHSKYLTGCILKLGECRVTKCGQNCFPHRFSFQWNCTHVCTQDGTEKTEAKSSMKTLLCCLFGSTCFCCWRKIFKFKANKNKTPIAAPLSFKVGVYVMTGNQSY